MLKVIFINVMQVSCFHLPFLLIIVEISKEIPIESKYIIAF
jgi:hypothetical protein